MLHATTTLKDFATKIRQFTNELIVPKDLAHFPNPIQQFFHPILQFQGVSISPCSQVETGKENYQHKK